jgi:2-isopropylmalate synthase
MLKHEETYEIMRPETVGVVETRLVLGKHSGRSALAARLTELGYRLEPKELEAAFIQFKLLGDKRKHITDADLEALVAAERLEPEPRFVLDELFVTCGTTGAPTARVRLRVPGGGDEIAMAIGTGPVDAVFKAIDGVVKKVARLEEYAVHAITEGIDALGEVSVRIVGEGPTATVNPQREGDKKRPFHGYGADTDIIVASAKAYVVALNRLVAAHEANGSAQKYAG